METLIKIWEIISSPEVWVPTITIGLVIGIFEFISMRGNKDSKIKSVKKRNPTI